MIRSPLRQRPFFAAPSEYVLGCLCAGLALAVGLSGCEPQTNGNGKEDAVSRVVTANLEIALDRQTAVSNASGTVRLRFSSVETTPQLDEYAGLLPGALEDGTVQVELDLRNASAPNVRSGETVPVIGTVIFPDGTTASLSDFWENVRACREGDAGFVVLYTEDGVEHEYIMIFDVSPEDFQGGGFTGGVTVTLRTLLNGEVLDETQGQGNASGSDEDIDDDDDLPPLPDSPTPLSVDAGTDASVEAGGSVMLQGTVQGGQGGRTVQWSPQTSLDDPTTLTPTATPTQTTVYTLTVTDSATPAQQAADTVTVTVNLPDGVETLFEDDFENDTTGATPASWVVVFTGDASAVSDQQAASGVQSMRMNANPEDGDAILVTEFVSPKDAGWEMTWAMRLSGSSTETDGGAFGFGLFSSEDEYVIGLTFLRSDGRSFRILDSTGETAASSVELGRWYACRAVVDPVAQAVDYYLDGELVLDDILYATSDGSIEHYLGFGLDELLGTGLEVFWGITTGEFLGVGAGGDLSDGSVIGNVDMVRVSQ